jgi:hypothetical protein
MNVRLLCVVLVSVVWPWPTASAGEKAPAGKEKAPAAQEKAPSVQEKAPAAQEKTPGAKDLFDGKTLSGWKPVDMPGQAKVYVKDGAIVMDSGDSMTAVIWTGKPPRTNYELTLDGMRLEGGDFFATTTFPVGDSFCSLVVGGWGGSVVGLSNVDHFDASENATSTSREFKDKTWYHVRIRVTDARIDVWIDGKQLIRQNRKDHVFDLRMECDPCRPLGICTWNTKGAVKNIRLREVPPKEAAKVAEEKDEE